MSFDLLGSLSSSSQQPLTPRCSRKACHADARWALKWNNPKVHSPERRKIWLACDEHRSWLADYLSTRGFLKDVIPVCDLQQPSASTPQE
jgi:hypothetical protein